MMKRALLTLLLLAIIAPSLGGNTIIVRRGAAAANASAIVFWLNFEENDTTGDYDMGAHTPGSPSANGECSDGDTSGAFAGDAALNSSSPIQGSYDLITTDGDDTMTFVVSTDDILPVAGRVAFRAKVSAATGGGFYFVAKKGTWYIKARAYGGGNGNILWYWDSTTIGGSCNASYGEDHMYEFKWDNTAPSRQGFIDGVACGSENTDAFTEPDATSIIIGTANSTSVTTQIDQVIITDDPDTSIYSSWGSETSAPSGACDG